MEERYAFEHVEAYRAYPFYKIEKEQKEDRVYGKIYLEETTLFGNDEGASLRVSMSLVNETMLQREYAEIDRENMASLFFYEFEGETTLKGEGEYAKRMMLKPLDSEKFYAIEMIDINARDGDIGWIEQQYPKNWIFIGEVLFSASPILTHKAAVIVKEELDEAGDIAKELQKTYDVWDDNIRKNCIYDKNQILDELKTLFDDCVTSKEVSIYNVGQANCCYCDLDSRRIFLISV